MAQHTLEEVCGPLAHSCVDEGLGSLDVVMEVIAEGLNVRNNLIAPLFGEMTREEHCRGQLDVEQ